MREFVQIGQNFYATKNIWKIEAQGFGSRVWICTEQQTYQLNLSHTPAELVTILLHVEGPVPQLLKEVEQLHDLVASVRAERAQALTAYSKLQQQFSEAVTELQAENTLLKLELSAYQDGVKIK